MGKIITLGFLLTVIISCGQTTKKPTQHDLSNDVTIETDELKGNNGTFMLDLKTIKLDFDFKVYVGREEDFEEFTTYSFFKLTRGDKTNFTDSSLTEYEFGNKLFPIALKTGTNSFELLFEINDRPNKNYLRRLFIDGDKLIRLDKLPTFEGKAIDINQDGVKKYAGYWDYFQIWGENDELTVYNPILSYSVTSSGLKLDSLMTRKRNKKIYGDFYGFYYNEVLEIPISVLQKFEEELNRIKGGR